LGSRGLWWVFLVVRSNFVGIRQHGLWINSMGLVTYKLSLLKKKTFSTSIVYLKTDEGDMAQCPFSSNAIGKASID
jgi:hypothetical protein